MSKIDKKLEQIKLQHTISEILRKDNGVSCHFDYHISLLSDDETITLNLLTYNVKHNEYMLLHTTKGSSSLVCLRKMLDYIESVQKTNQQYSFTVKWKKKNDSNNYLSYFWGNTEDEVIKKFLHEKNPDDYIFEIEQNPIA